MHSADIKARMEKRGYTQTRLAEEIGVSRQTLNRVIQKKGVSDKVMRAIARVVRRTPERTFPEYYLARPLRKRPVKRHLVSD